MEMVKVGTSGDHLGLGISLGSDEPLECPFYAIHLATLQVTQSSTYVVNTDHSD
jgi:hypothetical protein